MTKKKRVRHHVNPLADLTEHSFIGFDDDHPIIVDIGADHGEFVQRSLEKWGKNKNFILFEIRKPRVEQLQAKFARCDNVVIFDGDVVRNFKNILKPSIDNGIIVEEIYINFPDPWLKERHKKRRVITQKFITDTKKWMSKNAQWFFQTDQQDLFDETVEILQSIDSVRVTFFYKPPHGITTKWEDAKVVDGRVINRLQFSFS